jgi:hypothetical protein
MTDKTDGITEDLIKRVDSWINAHDAWLRLTPGRVAVVWDNSVWELEEGELGDRIWNGAVILGVLLALVRKALSLPFAYVAYNPSIQRFAVCDPETGCAVDGVKFDSVSEAEALVVALEAAQKSTVI